MTNRLLNYGRIVQDVWRVLLRRFPNVMISFGGNIRISSESWRWRGLVLCSTAARLLTSDRLVFTCCGHQFGLRELDILLSYWLRKHIIVGQRSFLDRKLEWIENFITFSFLEKEIIVVNFGTLLIIRFNLMIVIIVLNWGCMNVCSLLCLLFLLLLFLLVS